MNFYCPDCGPLDHVLLNAELSDLPYIEGISEDEVYKMTPEGEFTELRVEPNEDYSKFTDYFDPVPAETIEALKKIVFPSFMCPKCEKMIEC